MLSMDEARARVAKGAAHLDRVRPGWAERIDTGTLTLHDPCGCVVGQLCQSGTNFTYGLRMLDITYEQCQGYGFERDPNPEQVCIDDPLYDAWSTRQYRTLQDAWIEAIADRLAAATDYAQPSTAARV